MAKRDVKTPHADHNDSHSEDNMATTKHYREDIDMEAANLRSSPHLLPTKYNSSNHHTNNPGKKCSGNPNVMPTTCMFEAPPTVVEVDTHANGGVNVT